MSWTDGWIEHPWVWQTAKKSRREDAEYEVHAYGNGQSNEVCNGTRIGHDAPEEENKGELCERHGGHGEKSIHIYQLMKVKQAGRGIEGEVRTLK